MASLEELRSVRLAKIKKLQEAGMNPFPADVTRDATLQEVMEDFSEGATRSLVGRVTAIRSAGAISFIVINDGTGEFQAVLKKGEIEESLLELFKDTVDIADFVWFSGELFTTERGAKSILVKDWKMAGKALLPLPDKHAGLQDQDEIYRKRYLDTLTNSDSREIFKTRAHIISAIREFFDDRGFMEVETPILQNQAGGAMAQTFNTHHNDMDMDMVLRISLELEHKMIMAGGYSRIYEIGKNFRNEGSDPTHIQEFTMMEWYAAYETLEQNMEWTEELIKHLAQDVVGKTTFTVWDKEGSQHEVNLDTNWPRLRFPDLLKNNADLDIETASIEDIQTTAEKWGMPKEETAITGRANLLDFIYKKSSRNSIVGPAFVTDYPGDLKPLAQQNEDGTARVAQLIIGGAEITNQYAELVNPIKQRELLESQAQAREEGDAEAMELDERFLTAMEHGMPPMTGFGMGIDRLVAFFAERQNLRDVIFFPIVKPQKND
ncbi:lysine--tRNA ligase [Patescibacteria group bacterium]|nr:lysine--tRNA ligase [Patescibacteria group bacterium]